MIEILQIFAGFLIILIFGFIGMDLMLCFLRPPFVVQWFCRFVVYIINRIEKEN